KHLDAISIGAAGTFLIRQPVGRAQLRAELARQLPFSAEIIIFGATGILRLMSHNPFAHQPFRPHLVRFARTFARIPRSEPALPMRFPSSGRWLLKVLQRENRFVFGLYRRHLKVIGYLGAVDRLFGVPVTTRNWNTIRAVAAVLGTSGTP